MLKNIHEHQHFKGVANYGLRKRVPAPARRMARQAGGRPQSRGKRHEIPDVQAGFRKGSGTRDQISNNRWIIKKAREFQKNIYFCFIDYGKAFDYVNHNKLWEILKLIGIPDHLTCFLITLYAGQEATVRTEHGTIDWFQIRKEIH